MGLRKGLMERDRENLFPLQIICAPELYNRITIGGIEAENDKKNYKIV